MKSLIKELKSNKKVKNFKVTQIVKQIINLGTFGEKIGGAYSPIQNANEMNGDLQIEWTNGKVSLMSITNKAFEDPKYIIAKAESIQIDDPYSRKFIKKYILRNHQKQFSEKVNNIVEEEQNIITDELKSLFGLEESFGIKKHISEIKAVKGDIHLYNSLGLDLSDKSTSYNVASNWDEILIFEISKRKYFKINEYKDEIYFLNDMYKAKDKYPKLKESDKQNLKVLLSPDLTWDMFSSFLFSNLRGSMVANNQSRFKKSDFRKNKQVLSDRFTLKINPKKEFTIGASNFTHEGIETKETLLIKNGRLMTPILDLKHSQKLTMPPTSFITEPNIVSYSNKPSFKIQQYIKNIDKGIFIPTCLGLHTQNHITGDYSLPCPNAIYIKKGKFIGIFKVIIIGNFYNDLNNNLDLVKSGLFPTPGICYNPQVVFE